MEITENLLLEKSKKLKILPDKKGEFLVSPIKGFIPNKDTYYVILGLAEGHIYIYGETGLGKTESVYYLAGLLRKNIREINMSGEISRDNFVGYLTALNGNVFFQEGILIDCMRNGYWLLVDEIDYAVPAVLSVLNNVLQNGFYTIPETKEKVVAHPNFRLIATANTAGMGDNTGHYTGTNVLNSALMDRFESIIHVVFPEDKLLKKILIDTTGLDDIDLLTKVIKFKDLVRNGIETGNLFCTFGIRTLIRIIRKVQSEHYTELEAVKLSFSNKLDDDSKDVIEGFYARAFLGKSK